MKYEYNSLRSDQRDDERKSEERKGQNLFIFVEDRTKRNGEEIKLT